VTEAENRALQEIQALLAEAFEKLPPLDPRAPGVIENQKRLLSHPHSMEFVLRVGDATITAIYSRTLAAISIELLR
jgi:hypothetical protein